MKGNGVRRKEALVAESFFSSTSIIIAEADIEFFYFQHLADGD